MPNDRSLKSILLLAANPKSTTALRLQEEEREIKERLRLSGYGKVPVNSVVALRPRDIQQALLDFRPQVVHFSGHGANQQGLVFEDNIGNVKLIDSEALAQLFNLFSNRVECVVLNACYSATQAEAIAKHISYVVGMNTAIGDSAAIEFSVGFYAALGAGETFEFAYKMGCISIRLASVQGTHEHLTPELLKRESQVLDSLFNLEDTQEQDDFSNYDTDKKINTRTKRFRSSFRVATSMGEIRVIGPRNSGKTTFLAALADWHDIGFRKPIKAVEPLNEEALSLRWQVANILQEGARLTPTVFCVEYPPSYFFNIEITPNLWQNPLCWLRRRNIQFSITCKDFAGEFIQELINPPRTSHDYLENYLNDCAFATCLLVMIDGTDSEDRDRLYSQAFSALRKELSSRAMRGSRRLAYRIAIVFSKADQPPIWQYRYRLMEFVNKRFPYTKSVFQEWCNDHHCSISVAYFACSAFGMRSKPPQPNVSAYDDRGNCGCIEEPSVWQPFGLAAPIYWLSTGKRDSRLEKC